MSQYFSFSQFIQQFPTDESCLEEIKRIRFRRGVYCTHCYKITKHYKLKNRSAYSCEYCRNQIYPLAGTVFEKSTTPLHIWFYAMFLMTQTRARISVVQLSEELHVTYKTAWRIYHKLFKLMNMNNGDLLAESTQERRWTFFNKIEISFVEKKKK